MTNPEPVLVLRSRIAASASGMRLIDHLVARFPYHDRGAWQREIDAGRVHVDERPAAADDLLCFGARLAYHRVHAEPWVDDRIAVLHDDDTIVAVDKPAHLPMHADGPFVRATLVHLLRQRLHAPHLGLVHRLDRETSGVCVLARTAAARSALDAQFAGGRVHKVYHAIVRGSPDAEFTIDQPIGRSRHSTIALRRAAGAAAIAPQPALTRFCVVARGPAAALLQCEPASGRTHQIRVHLEHAGLPVLGDKLYGRPDDDYLAFVARAKACGDARVVPRGEPDRQLLHASELRLQHPSSGADTLLCAPLPSCFADWLGAPLP